ncbi:DUF4253 domain-containing protein [Thermoflavimicrobium daqui]|nr:DUF4253 domain-containing protein [Thermoflavimicrobium daqui]
MNSLLTTSAWLEEELGQKARPYSTYDFGRQKDEQQVSFLVDSLETGFHLVLQYREKLPKDLVMFVGTTNWLGEERHHGVELVIGYGKSQWDILRIARTDAANYNINTEDLITKLSQYHQQFGIDILQAETDTVLFDFIQLPNDLRAFCEDCYRFCPDIVDQGFGSIEDFMEAVEVVLFVRLWWD